MAVRRSIRWPASISATAHRHIGSTGRPISRAECAEAAHGLMINYLYELDAIETRHEAFVADGTITFGPAGASGPRRHMLPDRLIAKPENQSETPIMTTTLFETFEQNCRTYGDKPLFERPGQAPISFAAALDQTSRFATVLRDLGVCPGDRVAAQVDKSPRGDPALPCHTAASAASSCRSTPPIPVRRSTTSSATPSRGCLSAVPRPMPLTPDARAPRSRSRASARRRRPR